MYRGGNSSRMFLIHILLSHQNVGFKESFDVQLAFCFFFYGVERGKSRFFGCKLSSFGRTGDSSSTSDPRSLEGTPGGVLPSEQGQRRPLSFNRIYPEHLTSAEHSSRYQGHTVSSEAEP